VATSRLTIGELAKRAGVNRETIRYYERRRLLAHSARTMAGYRVFPDDAVDRLRFIRHAQALGFTLEEIRELLGLRLDERSSCQQVRARATRKLADVEAKIAALRRIRRVLGRLVHACEARRPTAPCPILESLAAPDERARKEELQ
jgi:MerR family mercuric resistance operon transcriptional regulator